MKINKISICELEDESKIFGDIELRIYTKYKSLKADYIIACIIEDGLSPNNSGKILPLIHYAFFIRNNKVIDYLCPGKNKLNYFLNVLRVIDRSDPLFKPIDKFYLQRTANPDRRYLK